MEFNLEELNSYQRRLTVTYSASELQPAFTKARKEIAKNAQLPGFRYEQAPRALRESFYKKQIAEQVITTLFQQFYQQVLVPHQEVRFFSHIDMPEPSPTDQSYTFTITYEVLPQVKLLKTAGLPLPKLNVQRNPNQKYITKVLTAWQREYPTFSNVPPPARLQADDLAYGDFKSFSLPEPAPPNRIITDLRLYNKPYRHYKNYEFYLSPPENHNGSFSSHLEGLALGETREFLYIFPNDYYQEIFKGRSLKIVYTLKKIKRKKFPAINDNFAQQLNAPNLEALRQRIREKVREQRENSYNRARKTNLLAILCQENPLQLPTDFVLRELDNMSKLTLSSFKKQCRYRDDYQPEATLATLTRHLADFNQEHEDLQEYLLFRAIQKQEEITINEEDIDNVARECVYSDSAAELEKEVAIFKTCPHRLATAKSTARYRKIYNWLDTRAQDIPQKALKTFQQGKRRSLAKTIHWRLKKFSNSRGQIFITCPAAIVKKTFQQISKAIAKNSKIFGFEDSCNFSIPDGQAPRALSEIMQRREILSGVRQALFKQFYQQIVQTGLITHPLDFTQIDMRVAPLKDQDYNFTATYEILQEIKSLTTKGLLIPKLHLDTAASDCEISGVLTKLQEESATIQEVTTRTTLQIDDIADLELKSFSLIKGVKETSDLTQLDLYQQPYHQQTHYRLELNPLLSLEWPLAEKLLGLEREREREFLYTFREDHEDPLFRGRTLKLNFTLKKIASWSLPVLDDDFAKQHHAPNLTALRQRIGNEIKEERLDALYQANYHNLLFAFNRANPLEIPKRLILRNIPLDFLDFIQEILAHPEDYEPAYLLQVLLEYIQVFNRHREAIHSNLLLEAMKKPGEFSENAEEIAAARNMICNIYRKNGENFKSLLPTFKHAPQIAEYSKSYERLLEDAQKI